MTSWLNSECFKVTKKATNYLLYKPGQICGQYSLLNNWKKRHLHVRTQPNTRAAGLIADSSASDSSQACLLLGIYQGSFDVDVVWMWIWLWCCCTYRRAKRVCCAAPTKTRVGFALLLGLLSKEKDCARERNRLSAVFLRRILPVKISSTSPARHSFRTIGGGSSTLSSARFTTDPDRIGYTPIPTIKSWSRSELELKSGSSRVKSSGGIIAAI